MTYDEMASRVAELRAWLAKHPNDKKAAAELDRLLDEMVMTVAVLFARRDSVYKSMEGCDVWDIDRDARKWPGGAPIVAHPPCRAWGRLRHFAKPRHDEKDLARFAVAQIRAHGGVLEHPESSQLWADQELPAPGERDAWGGWTLPVHQYWWGHRAQKKTLLYIVGCEPSEAPPMPLRLGMSDCVIRLDMRRADGSYVRSGDPDYKPRLQEAEREGTPPEFAAWLVELARSCKNGRSTADPKRSALMNKRGQEGIDKEHSK